MYKIKEWLGKEVLELMRIKIFPEIRRRIVLSGAKEKVRTRQTVNHSSLNSRRATSQLARQGTLSGEYDVRLLSVSEPLAYPTYFLGEFSHEHCGRAQ